MEVLSSRTILRPRDYDAALEFYGTTLGLAIAREYPGGTVFFAGQGLIEIAAHGGSDEPIRFPPGALWLQVRDVYSAEAELVVAGGIEIVRDARQEPWGVCTSCGSPIRTASPVVLVQIPPGPPDPARHPLDGTGRTHRTSPASNETAITSPLRVTPPPHAAGRAAPRPRVTAGKHSRFTRRSLYFYLPPATAQS